MTNAYIITFYDVECYIAVFRAERVPIEEKRQRSRQVSKTNKITVHFNLEYTIIDVDLGSIAIALSVTHFTFVVFKSVSGRLKS